MEQTGETHRKHMQKFLTRLIDFFYFPFIRRRVPQDVFRYAACGGGNMVFEWILYFICFHFIFDKANWDLGFVVISPHIAALLVSSPLSALTGFWLQKNITFRASPLRDATQFFRYFMVYGINLLVNYAGLKLLVDLCHFWPLPSKMAITVITVIFSYLMQKYFTFWRPKE